MFEVAIHAYGRKRVRRGPCEGLLNWPEHQWTTITRRPLGLARARKLADGQTCHAGVVRWRTSEIAYDNGKPPHLPEGWYPAETEAISIEERGP